MPTSMHLLQGTSVSVVYFNGVEPLSFVATITNLDPFTIATSSSLAGQLEAGSRAMIVLSSSDSARKADFHTVSVVYDLGKWTIEAESVVWDMDDRRRHPRYPVQVRVQVRAVQEAEGHVTIQGFEGVTSNLSLGGANIECDAKVLPGSLLNVTLQIEESHWSSVLGIATWCGETGGVGVEFLDFIGDAKYRLHTLLSSLAPGIGT